MWERILELFGSRRSPRTSTAATPDAVRWAYRLFLDREPKPHEVEQHRGAVDVRGLRTTFLLSSEFAAANPVFGFHPPTDSRPTPPPELIRLVCGHSDAALYLFAGAFDAATVRATAVAAGVRNFEAVLDFGCGCGRLLRHWADAGVRRLCGSDCNGDLVAWSAANLAFAEVRANGSDPPLAFADASFDFIYAVSVFTHLDEPQQRAWMREMARVLRPGGHLLFTVHGEPYLRRLSPDERARHDRGELAFLCRDKPGSNEFGTVHPRGYVEKVMTVGLFDIVHVAPRGLRADHDIYVVRLRG